MRILVDMNLTPDWVTFFTTEGIESRHWSTIGDPRSTDDVLLAWAREHAWIVFTNDLDFGALLAKAGANGPSVIQARTPDLLPASLGRALVAVLRRFEPELTQGALVVMETASARIRILPIHGRGAS
jgi:predicted nuclease of predicted toxin-antitoxin system